MIVIYVYDFVATFCIQFYEKSQISTTNTPKSGFHDNSC